MERLHLKRRYTRSDPRGRFPHVSGLPDLAHNRLGVFWRPIIDMTDSALASMRLRAIRPVSSWLAEPGTARRSWFSRIGVPGLRHQVLRHAGLEQYDCREPGQLPTDLHSREWNTLVRSIDRFAELDYQMRALVLFHLAQLSYVHFALKLASDVPTGSDPVHDRYTYEVARLHARYPGQSANALSLFGELAVASKDRLLALAACFQGIGHAIRNGNDLDLARKFESRARSISGLSDDWHASLVSSRFHRALALLRLVEGDIDGMHRELQIALALDEPLSQTAADDTDKMVAIENRRYLLELQIDAASRVDRVDSTIDIPALCGELTQIDPYCVEARLIVGDGYAAIADYANAARWYGNSGELGTGSGAIGWFRAAQCYDFMGDRSSAINAMGRCLELDGAAVEAREYIAGFHR